jgi:oxygen-dependent protoporphyrinogen oxidase
LIQLVETLASHLPADQIHLNSPTERIERTVDSRWNLHSTTGETCGAFQGVIVATPAPRAAELLAAVDQELSQLLGQIAYASSAVVSLSFPRNQIADPLDGFGLVVPTVENRPIVAASFSSVKFAERAPLDQVLVRVFLGGALNPSQVSLSDDALQEIAVGELRELIGLRGEPLEVDIVRWHEKMPQYHVGHVQLVEEIENRVAQQHGLELAGNAYHGVGIPQCIHSADLAARRLVEQLRQKT